jgi:hypothetical protein
MFLEFDVTAFGDDLWVEAGDAVEGVASNNGLSFEILKGGVATSTNVTYDVTYDIEGADEDNGYFELTDGVTYKMVVSVDVVNPEVSGSYSFRVNSVGYNVLEDQTGVSNTTPDDVTEYESDEVSIQS